jgi:hypothetical protein
MPTRFGARGAGRALVFGGGDTEREREGKEREAAGGSGGRRGSLSPLQSCHSPCVTRTVVHAKQCSGGAADERDDQDVPRHAARVLSRAPAARAGAGDGAAAHACPRSARHGASGGCLFVCARARLSVEAVSGRRGGEVSLFPVSPLSPQQASRRLSFFSRPVVFGRRAPRERPAVRKGCTNSCKR